MVVGLWPLLCDEDPHQYHLDTAYRRVTTNRQLNLKTGEWETIPPSTTRPLLRIGHGHGLGNGNGNGNDRHGTPMLAEVWQTRRSLLFVSVAWGCLRLARPLHRPLAPPSAVLPDDLRWERRACRGDPGRHRLRGRVDHRASRVCRSELGVSLVPEGRELWPSLSVLENLERGCYAKSARKHRDESLERVFDLFPKLQERTKQVAGSMSSGEQMFDESSLGLAPVVVTQVFAIIRRLAKEGLTILLVQQKPEEGPRGGRSRLRAGDRLDHPARPSP